MYSSVNIEPLSKSQHSRLQNGHGVRVKLSKSGNTVIKVSKFQMKKLLKAEKNGSAYTVTFDPVQQAEHKAMRGYGIKKVPKLKASLPRRQFTRLDVAERAMGETPVDVMRRPLDYGYEPEMDEPEMDGEGIKDFMKKVKRAKIGKKIVKFGKDNKILKRVGNALVERAIKTIAGSGAPKRKRSRVKVIKRCGGALYPSGYKGGALFPA